MNIPDKSSKVSGFPDNLRAGDAPDSDAALDPRAGQLPPLLVSGSTARRLLDIGSTRFWALVSSGKIEAVDIDGGRRMIRYDSLVALASKK